MPVRVLLALTAAAALGAGASGATFTFEDPSAAREINYVSGDAVSQGRITYLGAATVDLLIDRTDEGLGTSRFLTTLILDIAVGAASPSGAGFTAPISGFFRFVETGAPDRGADVLRGDFADGRLITGGSAGALITTSALALVYTGFGAGLPGLPADAVFTLTDITPALSINGDGYVTSFDANAAFTGTTTLPLPAIEWLGALGLAPLALMRRRGVHRSAVPAPTPPEAVG